MSRLQKGIKVTDRRFDLPLLQIVGEFGGSVPRDVVLHEIRRVMRPILGAVDYKRVDSGPIRLENTASYAAAELKRRGLLNANSPWGWWEITQRGREFLREQRHRVEKVLMYLEKLDSIASKLSEIDILAEGANCFVGTRWQLTDDRSAAIEKIRKEYFWYPRTKPYLN